MRDEASGRFLGALGVAFGAFWLALAVRPRYRQDWALENALTVMAILALALSRRRLPLSALSYSLIAGFPSLHAIGAHYTYSEVPYDRWFAALTGRDLNDLMGWERNHYDRLVHLLYGVLLPVPVREILVRSAGVRGFWSYFLCFDLTLSSSATYELIEWGAAVAFGRDLGMAYVGAQGDVWDAQRDMALAALGAAVAVLIMAMARRVPHGSPSARC